MTSTVSLLVFRIQHVLYVYRDSGATDQILRAASMFAGPLRKSACSALAEAGQLPKAVSQNDGTEF